MTFEWTPHRFSGGALALDVANSVILRADPSRRTDRFAVPQQLESFADAASRLCAERAHAAGLSPIAPENKSRFLGLREDIDAFYRARTEGRDDPLLLAALLERIAAVLRAHPSEERATPLDLATAQSALALVALAERERMKICPNCGWLFIDRSKNKSRAWCDMAVCGNRAKARLHYRKKKETAT